MDEKRILSVAYRAVLRQAFALFRRAVRGAQYRNMCSLDRIEYWNEYVWRRLERCSELFQYAGKLRSYGSALSFERRARLEAEALTVRQAEALRTR
jgi:hypothetical protein